MLFALLQYVQVAKADVYWRNDHFVAEGVNLPDQSGPGEDTLLKTNKVKHGKKRTSNPELIDGESAMPEKSVDDSGEKTARRIMNVDSSGVTKLDRTLSSFNKNTKKYTIVKTSVTDQVHWNYRLSHPFLMDAKETFRLDERSGWMLRYFPYHFATLRAAFVVICLHVFSRSPAIAMIILILSAVGKIIFDVTMQMRRRFFKHSLDFATSLWFEAQTALVGVFLMSSTTEGFDKFTIVAMIFMVSVNSLLFFTDAALALMRTRAKLKSRDLTADDNYSVYNYYVVLNSGYNYKAKTPRKKKKSVELAPIAEVEEEPPAPKPKQQIVKKELPKQRPKTDSIGTGAKQGAKKKTPPLRQLISEDMDTPKKVISSGSGSNHSVSDQSDGSGGSRHRVINKPKLVQPKTTKVGRKDTLRSISNVSRQNEDASQTGEDVFFGMNFDGQSQTGSLQSGHHTGMNQNSEFIKQFYKEKQKREVLNQGPVIAPFDKTPPLKSISRVSADSHQTNMSGQQLTKERLEELRSRAMEADQFGGRFKKPGDKSFNSSAPNK